ncbi:MAG: glycosyltransferase [Lachnospiraceae bacterium]
MGNPLVTVLMTTYNGEQFIRDAIESVLRQTYQNLELIIVLEADTKDNTCKIIQNFKDKRIKLIMNEARLGLDKSLNRGLDLAKGKYVARLDDDDICMPRRLEIQVKTMEKHTDLIMCGSNAYIVNDKNQIKSIEHTPKTYKNICYHLCFENSFISSSVMFRTKEIREKWKYEGMVSEDYLLWVKIAGRYKVCNIQQELVAYREYHGNRTKTFIQLQEKRDALIQKYQWGKKHLTYPLNNSFYMECKGNKEVKKREEMLKLLLVKNKFGKIQREENILLTMKLYMMLGMNESSAYHRFINNNREIYLHKKIYLYQDILKYYFNKEKYKLVDSIKIVIHKGACKYGQ